MDKHEYTLFGILEHLFTQTERAVGISDLARALALSEEDIEDGVAHLHGKGLVSEKLRLTMRGLAAASALSAARRARRAA